MKALVCLLDHSTNTDSIICANGESLLHAAAKLGCIHLTRMLLAREILSTLVDHVEKDSGQAPLHIAAKYNHVEIAKEFLLYGAKIDRQDLTGSTPIFTAASKGHSKMLKVFLQHTGKVELTCFKCAANPSIICQNSPSNKVCNACLFLDLELF